jgi:DNA-directed RNA polymerase subunit RPC12/RpoP
MPIKFRCPSCKQKIRVADEYAGREGFCPSCKKPLSVPAASTIPNDGEAKAAANTGSAKSLEPALPVEKRAEEEAAQAAAAPAQPTPASPKEAPQAAPGAPAPSSAAPAPRAVAEAPAGAKVAASFITFSCPDCGRLTGFPLSQAGTPASCPKCHAKIMIPERAGEPSFIIGAMPPKPPSAKPASSPRPLAPVVHKPHSPPPAPRPRRPAWQLTAIIVACLVGLIVAVMIIYREFRPYLNARGDADRKAAPTAPAPVPEPASAKAAPAPKPGPEPAPVPKEPAKAPTGTLPATLEFDDPTKNLNIASRPGVVPGGVLDPTKAFALDTKPKKATTEEDEEPAAPRKPAGEPAKTNEPAAKEEPKKADKDEDPLTKNLTVPDPPRPVFQPPAANNNPEPPPVCADCQGPGWLPLIQPKAYAWMSRDAAPDPQVCVPWRPCPKCNGKVEPKALVEAETARLAAAPARHDNWVKQLGIPLERGETRYVSLHAQLSPATARNVVVQLDKLTARLQADTKNTVFCQTRPDTHELLIVWDDPTYLKLIDIMGGQNPTQDWSLARKTGGVMSRNRCFFNAKGGRGAPPEDMALFQFAHMLMIEATDAKAPPWLNEGFAAYCENLILQRNLCHSIKYEMNEVQFSSNWNSEIRKYAQQNKLKPWDQIFPLDLIGLKALDYLTCYSMVCFLAKDPERFTKFVVEVRGGVPPPQALERAYGKSIKELQAMWAQWTLTQR